MRSAFSLLALLLFSATCLITTPASAMSDREVTRSYNGCMKYLKMTAKQQVKIAQTTGYTLKQLNWACALMKKNGLAKSIRLEHEYQRAAHSGGGGGMSGGGGSTPHDDGPPRCNFSVQCRGDYQCLDGRCIEKIRQDCQTSGLYACPSGEKCVSGECK